MACHHRQPAVLPTRFEEFLGERAASRLSAEPPPLPAHPPAQCGWGGGARRRCAPQQRSQTRAFPSPPWPQISKMSLESNNSALQQALAQARTQKAQLEAALFAGGLRFPGRRRACQRGRMAS